MNMKNKIMAGIIAALLPPACAFIMTGIIILFTKYDWISWIFTPIMCFLAAWVIYPNVKKMLENIDKRRKQR